MFKVPELRLNCEQVLVKLKAICDPQKVKIKQDKFGIIANNAYGVYQKAIKALAKEIGQDNDLALALFDSGVYEARVMCSKMYDPALLSEAQMEAWVVTFENWEICDSFCMGFFAKTEFALDKAVQWSERDEEFVKRAGYVLMACYGFVDKKAGNDVFESFFALIEREAQDERIYVKKAVNWALRNIGKRNVDLQKAAILVAEKLQKSSHKG
ncbi:MAG: DNA alkylation repair protein, partial [Psychrosphaera sp.]|nr:DNA alkylation repair protein [Psychrosphaera sp.]